MLLNRLLAEIGKNRKILATDNVVRCQPPGQASGAYERLVKATELRRRDIEARLVTDGERKQDAKKQAVASVPHAIDCCRPALMHDIRQYETLVPLGKVPFHALTGRTDRIGAVNGSPLRMVHGRLLEPDEEPAEGDRLYKVLPTFHPSAALQSPKWRFVLRDDLKKAFRFHADRLDWIDPEMVVFVNEATRDRWLAESPNLPFIFVCDAEGVQRWFDEYMQVPFLSFDTETSGIEALDAVCEMAQFGTPALRRDADGDWELAGNDPDFEVPKRTMAVLFVDEREDPIWQDWELDVIQDTLHPILEDEQILKVGHNVIGYDAQAISATPWRPVRYLECELRGVADTMCAVRAVTPDLPKGLKPAGSRYTDAERWESL